MSSRRRPAIATAFASTGRKRRWKAATAVAYGQVFCGQQKGKPYGVNIFFKAISGDQALYSAERDVHVPPGDGGAQSFASVQQARAAMKDQATADSYLVKSVYLCGARATDKRCK
jgi:hypothetical protein